MDFDWLSIVSTFGAAIAGSWFGARATNNQTKKNLDLAKNQWRRERAFEFIDVLDKYLTHSFRRELDNTQRDIISRKMIALTTLLTPSHLKELKNNVRIVREWNDLNKNKKEGEVSKKNGASYDETKKIIEAIKEDVLSFIGKDVE